MRSRYIIADKAKELIDYNLLEIAEQILDLEEQVEDLETRVARLRADLDAVE